MAVHLGALRCERAEDRRSHRNGTKPRQLNARIGKLALSVPQTRDGSFSTELLEFDPSSSKTAKKNWMILAKRYIKWVE